MAQSASATKKEAALIEAATLLLTGLPPTYSFAVPPPTNAFEASPCTIVGSPLTLVGQFGALFSLASNSFKRLTNSQIPSSPLADAAFNGAQIYMQTTIAGSATTGLASSNLGLSLKQPILDYHYRSSTLIPIPAEVSSILSQSTDGASERITGPSTGLLVSPNTQIIFRMRKAAKAASNASLSSFVAESFLNSQQGDLFTVGVGDDTATSGAVKNVYTKSMTQADVRLSAIDVTNLFLLPPSTSSLNAVIEAGIGHIAEVDLIECEIIRVWRIDSAALKAGERGAATKDLFLALAMASVIDASHLRVFRTIFKWAKSKAFGNAKLFGIAVGDRNVSGEELLAVNIAAQNWSANCMTAVTFRIGITVTKATLKVFAPVTAPPPPSSDERIAAVEHIDVWIHVPDHVWSPTNDMCKTHAYSDLSMSKVSTISERASVQWKEQAAATNEGDDAKRAVEEDEHIFASVLDSLHNNIVSSCEDNLYSEADAKNVWLPHLRSVLPPSRQLFVFNDSLPPHRPGFAKKG